MPVSSTGTTVPPDGGVPPGLPTSAVAYVDWLLTRTLNCGRVGLVLDTAAPLAVPSDMATPAALPSPQSVINRLKVLSGLDPVRFPHPIDGRIEKPRGDYVLIFDTRFEDAAVYSRCTIRSRISIRNR